MDLRRIFGNKAEDLTAKYLQNKGLKIIAKQYRSRFGEIDLIALDGSEVVFVEVKARKTSDFGFPEESVTASKIEKIIAVGDKFLKVAITFGKTELEFNHIEGVGE